MNGVVINADSAQVYRDLRIISAGPEASDVERVPHRLYGYRDGASACSAAEWAGDAKIAIRETLTEGRMPILVGGTGLYFRTLLDGIAPVPPIDPVIRTQVRKMPVHSAYAALANEDPEAARRLKPADTTRIARALEVIRSTGRSLSEWQKEKAGGIGEQVDLLPLVLLPPREWLYERCDRRFVGMMREEGLGEVRALLDRGLEPDLPVMRAIGVPEAAAYLEGRVNREAAIAAGQSATRRYAKRQYTWFKHQPPQHWTRFDLPLENEAAIAAAIASIQSFVGR